MLTGRGGDAWVEAAAAAAARYDVPLDVRFIGNGRDLNDPYGDWEQLREVEENGCILVRPDAHVGWRCHTLVPDAAEQLIEALGRILGRVPPPMEAGTAGLLSTLTASA